MAAQKRDQSPRQGLCQCAATNFSDCFVSDPSSLRRPLALYFAQLLDKSRCKNSNLVHIPLENSRSSLKAGERLSHRRLQNFFHPAAAAMRIARKRGQLNAR
jgi:hypothetical protein